MLNFLLFIGSYFSGFYLALFSAPVFAFVLYQAVYFFYPANRWWGYMVPDLSYSFFTVVLMMMVCLKGVKEHKKNNPLKSPPFKWIYSLLLISYIVSFYAIAPWHHDPALVLYLKMAITMSIAYTLVCTRKDLDLILYGYIFGAWYVSYYITQIGRNAGGRVEGIGTVDAHEANGIAAAIAPSIVIALYYFWNTQDKRLKLLLGIAGAFIANAIVLINSRGAFLGVAVSIFYFLWYLFFSSVKRKNQKMFTIGLVFVGLIATIKIVDDSFIQRVESIFTDEVSENQESGATRTEYWRAAAEMAQDHPEGLGTRGFDAYAPMYLKENIYTGYSRNRSVHSTWFEVLTELGYAGFFAFCCMIISCFLATKKCRKKLKSENNISDYYKVLAIEGALISFLITATFLNRYRAEVLYWCVLFAACAYNVYYLKSKTKPKQQ